MSEDKGFFKAGKGKFGKNQTPIKETDIVLFKVPKNTSQLENGGADGVNPYISAKDLSKGNGNSIIYGGVPTWISGYKFAVPDYGYIIRGKTFETLAIEKTLDDAHPTAGQDRIDLIVGSFDTDGNGVIEIVKGQTSNPAIKPTAKQETQIEITFIPVNGGTTQPATIDNLVVYNENVEFTTSQTGGKANFNALTLPFDGTKCINVTGFTTGDEIKFVNAVAFKPLDYANYQFQIASLSGKWQNNGILKIAFFNGATKVSDWVIIDSTLNNTAGNPYSFDSSLTTWQNIAVSLSAFNFSQNTADSIAIIKDDNKGAESFKLDLMRLQKGITSPKPPLSKTKLSEFINDVPFLVASDIIGFDAEYTIDIVANQLKLYKDLVEVGTKDLSIYLDDTNLARLTGGTLNGTTGIATFTRDDASTFTLDLSNLLDNQTASEVPFTPYLTITGTDLQSAVQELKDEVDTIDISGKVDKVTGYSLTKNDLTDILKSAYDSAVTWISTNGTNLINHLSNIANPHSVTKAQVGLGSVDNTSDANKPVSIAQQTALDLKVDASAYNDRFKGVYLTLSALNAAHPTANAGDYAQVNETGATDVLNYNWDAEESVWVPNAVSGSGATNTDQLPEGTTNLYHTGARVLATILTGISFVTGTSVVATDSILVGFGKLQKQINDLIIAVGLKAPASGSANYIQATPASAQSASIWINDTIKTVKNVVGWAG